MTVRRLVLGIPLALTLTLGNSARAHVPSPQAWRLLQQPQEEPTRSEAAQAFEAGEAAFAAGDFERATEQFARAQALVPHPHTAYNLGLAQVRADRPLEAWATFTALRDQAADPERRVEAELQLARLAPAVARLEVHAPEGHEVRVNGEVLDPDAQLVREPGPVQVRVGDQSLDLQLHGGELRNVDVRTIARPADPRAPKRGRLAVLAAAVATGAGTAGTSTAAALLGDRPPGRPLTYTAAALGGATLVLAATALGLHLRDR